MALSTLMLGCNFSELLSADCPAQYSGFVLRYWRIFEHVCVPCAVNLIGLDGCMIVETLSEDNFHSNRGRLL